MTDRLSVDGLRFHYWQGWEEWREVLRRECGLELQLKHAAVLRIPDAEHFDVLFQIQHLGPAILQFLTSRVEAIHEIHG